MIEKFKSRLAIRKLITDVATELVATNPEKAYALDCASTEIIDFLLDNREKVILLLSAKGGPISPPTHPLTYAEGIRGETFVPPVAHASSEPDFENDGYVMPPRTPSLTIKTVVDNGEEIELVS